MPPTKTGTLIDAFLEIAQNAIRIGNARNITLKYEQLLLIDIALTSETPHDGTEILVEISEETSGNNNWTELTSFIAAAGTAASELTDNSPLAIGEGVSGTPILVTLTGGFEVEGVYLFLKDVTDFADSEIVYMVSFSSDTSIALRDGVTNAHAVSSTLYSIAQTYPIRIPPAARRVRVTYNNTKDSGGSTVATRSRIAEITAL